MIKLCQLFVVFGLLTMPAYSQARDFPIGFDGVPQAKLKGPVRSVLTIEQRGEDVFSTVVETYDQKGKLIETFSSNAGIEIHSGSMVRLGGKTIYTYDSEGRLAKEMSFTPEGEYTGYEIYLYDPQNRLIGTTNYDASGKETGKTTYNYFSEKREVLATWNFYYEGRIPPPMKNLLSYNENGQWTKRTEFASSGKPDLVVSPVGYGRFLLRFRHVRIAPDHLNLAVNEGTRSGAVHLRCLLFAGESVTLTKKKKDANGVKTETP